MVGPGLCARYIVRFSPDALCDFHDHIRVLGDSDNFSVQLPDRSQACPPNRASLPSAGAAGWGGVQCAFGCAQGLVGAHLGVFLGSLSSTLGPRA